MSRRRRVAALRVGLAFVVAWTAVLGVVFPSRAGSMEFGAPTASATYGTGLEFAVDLTLELPVERVDLLLWFGTAEAPLVLPVEGPLGVGDHRLQSAYTIAEEGHVLPNTKVRSAWRAVAAETTVLSDPADVTYADDRFAWRTATGDIVRVHWYEGSAAFGERAIRIAEDAIAEAEALLGVTEDEPVDFFIYADEDDFYEALGPGTPENVGGQAWANIRTLFALIRPDEIDDDWVATVIPHELDHLVFDTAVANPYRFPPKWLNEGLAVYLSQGYGAADRAAVAAAAEAGTLMPLTSIKGDFPTVRERFFLAYSASVSAVDFIIREHGQDALVELITAYASGTSDDEAFRGAIGMDAAEFDAAWFASLGAEIPERAGPQPAPGGPLPPGWTGDPAASPAPAPSGTPGPGAETGDDGASTVAVLVAVVAASLALAGAAWLIAGRRRSVAATPPPSGPSDATDR